MENISQDIKELAQNINLLIANYSKLLPAVMSDNRKDTVSEKNINTTQVMTGYFEMMLGATKGMLGNMGLMDSGFAKTVNIILQILSSIGTGSGGFGGLFSGLLGVIGGVLGGPLGTAIGGGIGSVLGHTSSQVNQTSMINSSSAGNGGVVNQVIIKNPVTFTKAFDVEVRTRSLRGGIDL